MSSSKCWKPGETGNKGIIFHFSHSHEHRIPNSCPNAMGHSHFCEENHMLTHAFINNCMFSQYNC